MKKISVCGKGGSGKSTIVTLLANGMRERGYRVLVVDSDESNPGLYRMLGFVKRPVPLLDLVGGKKNVFRTFSEESKPHSNILTQEKISVADLPRQYLVEMDNIGLVCIGKILQSLEGCACPMGALSREFLKRLYLQEDEVAIVDMEAGIEHLGRATAQSVNKLLVVVEPGRRSIDTAEHIKTLAGEIGLKAISMVGNKIRGRKDEEYLQKYMPDFEFLGFLPYEEALIETDLNGISPFDTESQTKEKVFEIIKNIR